MYDSGSLTVEVEKAHLLLIYVLLKGVVCQRLGIVNLYILLFMEVVFICFKLLAERGIVEYFVTGLKTGYLFTLFYVYGCVIYYIKGKCSVCKKVADLLVCFTYHKFGLLTY